MISLACSRSMLKSLWRRCRYFGSYTFVKTAARSASFARSSSITCLRLVSTGSGKKVIPRGDPFFGRPGPSRLVGADPGRCRPPAAVRGLARADHGRGGGALLGPDPTAAPSSSSSSSGENFACRSSRSRVLCISRLKSSCSARIFFFVS